MRCSSTACLLKNEPASLCVLRMAKGDEPGALGKPSVNSAFVVRIRPEAK